MHFPNVHVNGLPCELDNLLQQVKVSQLGVDRAIRPNSVNHAGVRVLLALPVIANVQRMESIPAVFTSAITYKTGLGAPNSCWCNSDQITLKRLFDPESQSRPEQIRLVPKIPTVVMRRKVTICPQAYALRRNMAAAFLRQTGSPRKNKPNGSVIQTARFKFPLTGNHVELARFRVAPRMSKSIYLCCFFLLYTFTLPSFPAKSCPFGPLTLYIGRTFGANELAKNAIARSGEVDSFPDRFDVRRTNSRTKLLVEPFVAASAIHAVVVVAVVFHWLVTKKTRPFSPWGVQKVFSYNRERPDVRGNPAWLALHAGHDSGKEAAYHAA